VTFTYNGTSDVPVSAGTYAVVASFAGDANHEPASSSATVTIEKAAVVLQWTRPGAIAYGTPLGAAQLAATANVPGTFAYTPGAGTVLAAGASRALAAAFTPADPANFSGGSVETTIDVLPAPLTIRGNDVAKPFGAPVPVLTASASGFVNGESWAALNGSLTVTTTAVAQSAVGTYPVTPSGVSSSNYSITFASGALSVVRGLVVVSVTSSPQPSGFDQPLVLSASVAAAAPAVGNPGGTLQFFDGSVLLGSVTLSPAGTASLSTAGLDAGSHTIEARFNGDASFAPGAATAPHVVMTPAETPSIVVTSSRNPSNVGQTVTLTATVSFGAGSVEFYDGATLLGTAPISAGRSTFTTSAFAAGSHAVTARYLGTAGVPPSQSTVFVQAVGEPNWKDRTSSTVVSTSPSSSTPGSPVTISATVSGSSGTPTGTILFMVNGEVVGSVEVTPVSGSASTATFSLPGLAGGRHKVSATYLGNSNYKGSTAQVTHSVN
jgi:large repetitive protein